MTGLINKDWVRISDPGGPFFLSRFKLVGLFVDQALLCPENCYLFGRMPQNFHPNQRATVEFCSTCLPYKNLSRSKFAPVKVDASGCNTFSKTLFTRQK